MTHKALCIESAMQYLEQLQLSEIFSTSVFNHYYRKNNGANGNAFFVGLNAADTMIQEAKPATLIYSDNY